jgi:hypothetical protein
MAFGAFIFVNWHDWLPLIHYILYWSIAYNGLVSRLYKYDAVVGPIRYLLVKMKEAGEMIKKGDGQKGCALADDVAKLINLGVCLVHMDNN